MTRHIAGETLLVPVHAGAAALERIYLLNRVAAFLWEQLDGRRGLAELVALVGSHFAIADPTRVEADVRQFLGELERRGLARPVASEAA